ncbi:MAG: N-acetyl sugar amidotransferase [Chloroflexi bacterium]|nr:N-acetyl sugar amidotransferase [Chloroflexota bacterium]
MKYCVRCVMPETRPGIQFNEADVCSACQAYERRQTVDYKKRYEELRQLCDKYRGMNGKSGYDCMIAVSGGKDSHYQTHIMKEEMGMNPLLVTVEDNFPLTEAGMHNLKNISEEFGCDIISMKPNIKVQKIIMRVTFEKYAKPTYFIDRYIYTYPLQMAAKFNTPLLVYGENINYEYGGAQSHEDYSAKEQIENGVAAGISLSELAVGSVTDRDLNFFDPPAQSDLQRLDPIYLSYFVPWNSYGNYIFARSRGFHDLTHEWERTHHIEQFDQVDSRAYLIHPWMKYPKFGHASATDYAARFIRYGLLTRAQAQQLVREHDHKLDVKAVRDFCEFLGYKESEFWAIVDKFYNPDLFQKNGWGEWVLKDPVWEH